MSKIKFFKVLSGYSSHSIIPYCRFKHIYLCQVTRPCREEGYVLATAHSLPVTSDPPHQSYRASHP